jgi:hypothetical protein
MKWLLIQQNNFHFSTPLGCQPEGQQLVVMNEWVFQNILDLLLLSL